MTPNHCFPATILGGVLIASSLPTSVAAAVLDKQAQLDAQNFWDNRD